MKSLHACLLVGVAVGCSAGGAHFGDDGGLDDSSTPCNGCDGSSPPNNDSGNHFGDAAYDGNGGDGGSVTTVYANTDDTLYTLDPSTNTVTLIGPFAGTSDASTDRTVTDLAVNAAGDVYVNTESVVYKATIPTTIPGTVQLQKIATIAVATGQKFFALAFAPAGALDTGEVLVGGDGNGELYSIDTGTGATRNLGNFGPDPAVSGNVFALSGDLVFYMDAKNNPTGLATIRSCKSTALASCKSTMGTPSDYLAAVDMTALATAYKNSTPAASVRKGIYGETTSTDGTGTKYGDLYGLGAWEGNVYAFARQSSGLNPSPALISIDTTTGVGSVISSSFPFTNGWSGAGVTTSVTITVPPPN